MGNLGGGVVITPTACGRKLSAGLGGTDINKYNCTVPSPLLHAGPGVLLPIVLLESLPDVPGLAPFTDPSSALVNGFSMLFLALPVPL